MTDVTLDPITSGYNLSKLNTNFDLVQNSINVDVLHRQGGNNTMLQDLDMNSNAILNVSVDTSNPGSILTVESADARYYNLTGDTLTGPMDVNNQVVSGLKVATQPSEAVSYTQLTDEIYNRAAADANIQEQLTGNVPLEASAFSPVSWHEQSIDNSITIPDNKNAWSFGPTMTISSGQVVTIGTNSFWTIANGATSGTGALNSEIPAPLDFGTV